MSYSPSSLQSARRQRVVVAGGAYAGESTLETFLTDDLLAKHCQVVGLLFDNPANPVCNASNRTWRYLDIKELPLRVERLAHRHGIPTFSGNIQESDFHRTFFVDWKPDLIVSCFYGQKLPDEYLVVPRLGAINAHPCVQNPFSVWPSEFARTFAINRILAEGHTNLHWAAHYMTQDFDSGPVIAYSPSVELSRADSTARTYEKQAPHVARFLADVVSVLIGKRQPQAVRPPMGYSDFGTFNQLDDILARNPYSAMRYRLGRDNTRYGGLFFEMQRAINESKLSPCNEPKLPPCVESFLRGYLMRERQLDEAIDNHNV